MIGELVDKVEAKEIHQGKDIFAVLHYYNSFLARPYAMMLFSKKQANKIRGS